MFLYSDTFDSNKSNWLVVRLCKSLSEFEPGVLKEGKIGSWRLDLKITAQQGQAMKGKFICIAHFIHKSNTKYLV